MLPTKNVDIRPVKTLKNGTRILGMFDADWDVNTLDLINHPLTMNRDLGFLKAYASKMGYKIKSIDAPPEK